MPDIRRTDGKSNIPELWVDNGDSPRTYSRKVSVSADISLSTHDSGETQTIHYIDPVTGIFYVGSYRYALDDSTGERTSASVFYYVKGTDSRLTDPVIIGRLLDESAGTSISVTGRSIDPAKDVIFVYGDGTSQTIQYTSDDEFAGLTARV